MTQLTPEHFELHDSNKAKRYEQKQKEKKDKQKLFDEAKNKLDKLFIAYNEATNEAIKEVHKNKWIELLKVYANKL